MNDPVYLLTENDHRTLTDAIDAVRAARNGGRGGPGFAPGGTGGGYLAKTPAGIAGRDGTRPGRGRCSLYRVVGGDIVPALDSDSNALSVIVCNTYDTAVPANKYFRIEQDHYGAFWAENPRPCACVSCSIFSDDFSGTLALWEVIRGSWATVSGSIQTSSVDALILWDGAYDPDVGIRFNFGSSPQVGLRLVVDYVDDDNYHFAEFYGTRTQPTTIGIAYTHTGRQLRLYKREGGTDTLLYDYELGVTFNSGQVNIHVGGGYLSLDGLAIPTTLHGGTRLGIGTTSSFTGTLTCGGVSAVYHGPTIPCRPLVLACPQCVHVPEEPAWDMMVTLKMSTNCDGVAMPETNFVLPYTGVDLMVSFTHNCSWTVDSGLPCGWYWMMLRRGAPAGFPPPMPSNTRFTLYIAGYNETGTRTYTYLGFVGPDDCNGPWRVATQRDLNPAAATNYALRYRNGIGVIADGGVFDVDVCKVSRV